MYNCFTRLPVNMSSNNESSLIARDVFFQVHQHENTINPD
jgi:hypothetical protein